jgi:hypothetical protein
MRVYLDDLNLRDLTNGASVLAPAAPPALRKTNQPEERHDMNRLLIMTVGKTQSGNSTLARALKAAMTPLRRTHRSPA